MKIFVYYVGKPRDPRANGMAEEFIQTSTRYARCEMREIVLARFDPWGKHPSATRFAAVRQSGVEGGAGGA
jgi:23S rRNA (pseudouridine1915-N3)-methyltransferase